jgi:hypothetical protein
MLGVNHIILFKCLTDKMSINIKEKKKKKRKKHFFFISIKSLKISSVFVCLVIDVTDDPNCAKCDSRAVCIRLSNATGVSCICLPGFALSSTTGRCVLQGNRKFMLRNKKNFL